MRTEKEILDVLAALKKRKEFFEEHEELETDNNMPDPIEESANKMLALLWVLGEIDDIHQYPKTRKSLNQEKMCLNILQNIYQKEKDKKEKSLQDIIKSIT